MEKQAGSRQRSRQPWPKSIGDTRRHEFDREAGIWHAFRQAVGREAGRARRQAVYGDASTMERQAGRQSTAREAAIIETGSRQGGRQLRARRSAVYREAGTMDRQAGSRQRGRNSWPGSIETTGNAGSRQGGRNNREAGSRGQQV